MQTIFRRKKHTQILYSLKVHDLSASIYIWDDFWDYIIQDDLQMTEDLFFVSYSSNLMM